MADDLKFALILSAVDRLSPIIKAVDGKLDGLRDRVQRLADATARWGAAATIAGGAAAAALAKPVAAFAELEDAQTRLRSSLMDRNGVSAGFAELDGLAKKLGNRLPGTTADFYAMFDALTRKGVPSMNILKGIGEAAAYLGVVLKLPYTEAAELAANLQKSLGIAERDLLGFMDTVQRANFLGVMPRDMEYAFGRSAGALKALGLQGKASADALAPLFAMLIPVTNSGETAGSGLAAILRQAMDAGALKGANKELAKFGINLQFADQAGNFAGVSNLIAQLEKLKGLSQTDKLNALTALFGSGSEAQTVASTLMTEGVAGYNAIIARMQQQADLNARVSANLKTLTNVWDAASGTFTSTLAEFGAAIGPELKMIAEWFGRLSERVGQFTREWPTLTKFIGLGVLGFAALALTLGTLLLAVSGVLRVFLMFGPALKLIGTVAALVGRGFGIAVTVFKALGGALLLLGRVLLAHPLFALASLALLVITNWSTVKTWFSNFFSWISGKTAQAVKLLASFMPDWLRNLIGGSGAVRAAPARPRVASVAGAAAANVGGTVTVKIDADGRPRVQQVRSSNPRVPINVDVGRSMVAP